ncbi:MAG: elongation factor G [Acidobacteria bacterium]|nr:elongation factor G [Acidobacteriota bacterium]
MKVYDAGSLRNVALVGHSGAGKTQLASTLLFTAAAVTRHGKVDDGTTVTDYDDEEIARKHTLSASLAFAEWQKTKINFVDTPGMANFLSEARAALRVCDCALVVVDAVSGAQVTTEKTWAVAEEYDVPRIVVLNRLDRERANLDRALASMHEAFGRSVVPVQLPIGEEKDFRGVVDLLSMKAVTFSGGKPQESEIPAGMADQAKAAREALIEMVAEADDTLMEKFFEAGTLTQEELAGGLKRGVLARRIFPMLCASAIENVGSQALLDAVVSLAPSPLERALKGVKIKGGEEVDLPVNDSAPCAAFVWKTMADPFAGRITMFRVLSGSLKSDATVQNVTRDTQERLGSQETTTNDTLGEKTATATLPAITFPEPVISYAIEPKSRGDEDKISTSLHRLQEEDPTIAYTRDPQTKELLLAGQGQMHIEVTVAKLKRRFGVEVNLKLPRIPYRETITVATDAHGRHKKQTGGHGQFGDCKITVEPLPRGSDFEFVDDIFGGSIPRQFIPAVEKGIQDTRMRGYLAGYPVVDFRVRLTDGQFHAVDSNELSFKMAGSLAFKDAMSRARPTLLEPIMDVEIYAPSDYAGDLMGDINGRRGRVQGMEQRGSMTVVKAQVPMAEMLTYEQHLTSATGGRGSYHMEYSHYEEVPAHLHGKIIAASKAERGQEAAEEV